MQRLGLAAERTARHEGAALTNRTSDGDGCRAGGSIVESSPPLPSTTAPSVGVGVRFRLSLCLGQESLEAF